MTSPEPSSSRSTGRGDAAVRPSAFAFAARTATGLHTATAVARPPATDRFNPGKLRRVVNPPWIGSEWSGSSEPEHRFIRH